MTSTATQVLNITSLPKTANLSSSHENFGDVARHVEDESSDSKSPTLALFVASGADDTLKGMTNFSSPELNALWVTIAWTQGRGRKPSVSGKYTLFITLTVLKHFNTWHKHAIDFNMDVSTLEKMVHRVIQTIEPVLCSQLVKRVKMNKQIQEGNTFSNYPMHSTRRMSTYRLTGRFTEQKVHFSAKHKLYGFKIECSVRPPGVAVDVSDHAPGSRSDLTMMLDRLSIHRQMLKKEDDSVSELGGKASQCHQMWGVLVAKGYKGAGRVLRTIQPRKQPRGGTLDHEDIARNKAISADRVLVENFFGRMCLLWKATYATFKWIENRFDSVARLCTALTNYHVGLMPLRARGNERYDMVLFKYQAMGYRIRTQRARAQRHYRMRQQVRSRSAPYNTRAPASHRETQFDSQESFAF
ncbi:LOW QUALITY PROTEIN: hypothetical protein PHMEG_0002341 [Phytophthora megakarya]|uniref:DDE Tnp4 domain-containing protein n=1 Tax=Phytophthora megakarya TaxID=4795 RepID=A0A225X0N9_9STRA|nr:LOW QUALITY PROTEIN: hypothetical protein PHMEG_0002341 [Phytophthora megakarya]